MVGHHQNTVDASSRNMMSSGPETGVRKFTLSCSRCRASKLKCDKREPCMECVKRNIGHLCTKDERQPRTKRAKVVHNHNINNTKTSTPQDLVMEAEEAAQSLEDFVDGTSRPGSHPSTLFEPESSAVAPDYPNLYWSNNCNLEIQGIKMALIREIVDSMPELDIIHLLYEIFVTRCQGPLGNVVHTPSFVKQAERYCGCLALSSLDAQVIALSNAFSMDTLACHLFALVLALAFHPTPSILGWSATPLTLRVEEFRTSDVHRKTWRSLALRCLQGKVTLFCGSIASLQAAIMLLLDGQEDTLALDAILVTSISGAQKLRLHRLGDVKLKTSPPSPSPQSSESMESSHIRTEIGVRIWWALVMRDWSRGQTLGYYSIRPSQFNTRMPLYINDDDLFPGVLNINSEGHITERPRTEFTMLSYTIHTLEVAILARESIDRRSPLYQAQRQGEANEDAKMRNHLNKKYETFVAGLPSYFRIGSTVGFTSTGLMAAIPAQRWMLHQQLWSLFLRLHRVSSFSQEGRALCQLLAQNIISTHAQIQARCAVCSSLSTNETQLFNAAIVLLIGLLFSSKPKDADDSSAQLNRLMTRDKAREALELLRSQKYARDPLSPQDCRSERADASTKRSVIALEALLRLEEEEYDNRKDVNQRRLERQVGSDSSERKSPRNKVLAILEDLQGKDARSATATTDQASLNSVSAPDMPLPLPATTDDFQDMDVLPVLSNDLSNDLWQFFDFDPRPPSPNQNDYLSGLADSQSLIDSMPHRPPSSSAHSPDNSGTQEFAGGHSSTDSIRVTAQTSFSIESEVTKLSGGSRVAPTPLTADAYEFYYALEEDTVPSL